MCASDHENESALGAGMFNARQEVPLNQIVRIKNQTTKPSGEGNTRSSAACLSFGESLQESLIAQFEERTP